MLIITSRHTERDLAIWRRCEQEDDLHVRRLGRRLDEKIDRARDEMRAFIELDPSSGYVSISWGKDSLIVAWLLWQLEQAGIAFPACWIRVREWENPDCLLVRDAFLARFPLSAYGEVEVDAGPNRAGGTSKLGFAEAAKRHGARYISGVRADESRVRRISIGHRGIATKNTCRPLGYWHVRDVFAVIHREQLPLHPAYGYTMGGAFDRLHLRTSSLGGWRGTEHGRGEWERIYYGVVLPWTQ